MPFVLLLLLAQAPADEDADLLRGPGAFLTLQLDSRGRADMTFTVLTPPADPQALLDALGRTLGGTFTRSAVQSQAGFWAVQAHSDDAFRRRGLLVSGRLDLPVLAGAVRPLGARHLVVNLQHPAAGSSRLAPGLAPRTHVEEDADTEVWSFEVPGAGGRTETGRLHQDRPLPHDPVAHWRYAAPLALAEASPLELDYGYRPVDLLPLLPIPALLLVPLGLTLWRRRVALRATQTNPAAAWFGYWRFLRGLVLATEFGWLAAVLGLDVRAGLDRLLHFAL